MIEAKTQIERELIHAARRGDLRAFNRLVEMYQD